MVRAPVVRARSPGGSGAFWQPAGHARWTRGPKESDDARPGARTRAHEGQGGCQPSPPVGRLFPARPRWLVASARRLQSVTAPGRLIPLGPPPRPCNSRSPSVHTLSEELLRSDSTISNDSMSSCPAEGRRALSLVSACV
ncbi:hypothetical protein HPB50_013782 [Hyalomma asiaticum]|uniref:Uncharacterized protein n=1 Tax=Hyalomma asiaticum TaxID=266040 RepID=A0ACB7TKH8_HYAAI|nr:hypothetical protein HPB50_013782 [Hyalomma asiaticum]